MFGFIFGAVIGAGINEFCQRNKREKYKITLVDEDSIQTQPKLSYILMKRDEDGYMIRENILSAEGIKVVNDASVELLSIFMVNGFGWQTMKSGKLWYDMRRVHNINLNTIKKIHEWNSTGICNVNDDFMDHLGELIFIDLSYENSYIVTLAYFYDMIKNEYRYIGESGENTFIKGEYRVDLS